ncbi:11908_t:CDS:1 [Funneliformis geosporum]|nr:11908_t:CDS:1 [Funneliformis geosporum]
MVNQEDINSQKEKYEKILKTLNESLKGKEKELEEINLEVQSLNQQLANFHNSRIRRIISPKGKERINKKTADCLIKINELNNEISEVIKEKTNIQAKLEENVVNTEEVKELEKFLIVSDNEDRQDLKKEKEEVTVFSNCQDINRDFTPVLYNIGGMENIKGVNYIEVARNWKKSSKENDYQFENFTELLTKE